MACDNHLNKSPFIEYHVSQYTTCHQFIFHNHGNFFVFSLCRYAQAKIFSHAGDATQSFVGAPSKIEFIGFLEESCTNQET